MTISLYFSISISIMQAIVNQAVHHLKATILPLSNTRNLNEESINFVRFHNDSTASSPPALTPTTSAAEHAELHTIPSSHPPADHLKQDSLPVEGGYCSMKDNDKLSKQSNMDNDNDKISAWQAGWNVTNAIQVSLTSSQHIINNMKPEYCLFPHCFLHVYPLFKDNLDIYIYKDNHKESSILLLDSLFHHQRADESSEANCIFIHSTKSS